MKKYWGWFAVAVVAVVISSCTKETLTADVGASAGANIGVMDAVRLNAGAKVTKSLARQKDAALEKIQSAVEKKRKDFEKKETELKGRQLALGQEAFMKEAAAFRTELMEYDRSTAAKVSAVEKGYVEALAKVQKDYLDDIVKKIGREKGYDLVINSQTAILLNADLDITDEVIRALDARVSEIQLKTE
ncbi:MAG: OmpH family outer membrane protein [Rickettsiales bacterium]|nr:OmpH family outer membrane protein [Rickettsiales bacterium]